MFVDDDVVQCPNRKDNLVSSEAIKSAILALQQIYTVILGLALGEAFKQVVSENKDVLQRKVDWSKLPNLVSLMALIIPFLHGLNRYFFEVYIAHNDVYIAHNHGYGIYLLVDCIAFTIEGGLFFLLARSLSRAESTRFYFTVAILLCIDIVWGSFIWHFHTPSVKPWVIVNLIFGSLMIIILVLLRERAYCQAMCVVLVISRSVCDYIFSWTFYFPAP